jgi:hypothetical protein
MEERIIMKPTYKFDPRWERTSIVEGLEADIWSRNDPRFGDQWLTTSTVLNIRKDDSGKVVWFETKNSVYEAV